MIKFKNDPRLLAFAGFVLVVTAGLVAHGDVTWKEAATFLTAAFGLPGLFGAGDKEGEDAP